jgi:phage-related protein
MEDSHNGLNPILKEFQTEYAASLDEQKKILDFLLRFERFIYIKEDLNLPPNNVYIHVSKDIARIIAGILLVERKIEASKE